MHLSAVVAPLPRQTYFNQHYGNIIKWVLPQGLHLFVYRTAENIKLTPEMKKYSLTFQNLKHI